MMARQVKRLQKEKEERERERERYLKEAGGEFEKQHRRSFWPSQKMVDEEEFRSIRYERGEISRSRAQSPNILGLEVFFHVNIISL